MADQVQPNGGRRAFLDFYAQHHVVPVHYERDEAFVARRTWLSATLGIPPALLRDADVLEFGPGTGDNATVTASHGPRRYVLVDANPASLEALHERFPAGGGSVEIVASSAGDFVSDERFDVVIAENVIPGQLDPAAFLTSAAGFVRPGGALIVTCTPAAGLLADACRHLLRVEFQRRVEGFDAQVVLGASVLESHLTTLGPSTRSPEDWVVDNVLHDWLPPDAPLFDPRLAVEALVPLGLDVLSSSPRVGEDERWFKHTGSDARPYGERFINRFDAMLPGLLDHRVALDVRMSASPEAGDLLAELFRLRTAIVGAADYAPLPDFLKALTEIGRLLPPESAATVAAIEDFCGPAGMAQVADGAPFPAWPEFRSWWGRGVFYVSFWRRTANSAG